MGMKKFNFLNFIGLGFGSASDEDNINDNTAPSSLINNKPSSNTMFDLSSYINQNLEEENRTLLSQLSQLIEKGIKQQDAWISIETLNNWDPDITKTKCTELYKSLSTIVKNATKESQTIIKETFKEKRKETGKVLTEAEEKEKTLKKELEDIKLEKERNQLVFDGLASKETEQLTIVSKQITELESFINNTLNTNT